MKEKERNNTTQKTEETETAVTALTGKVNCNGLNVRAKASTESEVLAVIHQDDEVVIDGEASTDEWYAVCTAAGVNGFCMKQYITVSAA